MTKLKAADFWHFSLDYYSQIKPICLAWQDQLNANVNLLLLLCYLEQQQLAISKQTLASLDKTLSSFNKAITQRLRSLRRRASVIACLTKQQKQHFKQQLLKAELVAEQQEQQLLIQALVGSPNSIVENASSAPLLELYLAQLQQPVTVTYQQQIAQLRQALTQ